MSHWAASPLDRNQVVLFCPTLDDQIPADHPVRFFDEVLRGVDWGAWESMYVRVAGQPPIHPRVMASAILYGLSLGIRSSRVLENACANRFDFYWLLEGRVIDHSTLCKFRTGYGPQLKDLFVKIGRLGIEMGLVTLNLVTLDGTDVKAHNARFNTARRSSLAEKLCALDKQVEEAMRQAERQDREDEELFGHAQPAKLPPQVADLRRRQEKLKKAMKKLEGMERQRAGRKDVSARGPAVPLNDPDSRVIPAKAGGYAPAYTAVLAVDADSGMILDSQVLGGNDEASTVLPAVQNIQASFGKKPQALAADGGFNSGPNLEGLAGQQVEALMPPKQGLADNPAPRPDPTVAVPSGQWDALAKNPQNKILDKASFVYDPAKDRYFCPTGRVLDYHHDNAYDRGGAKGTYRIYQSADCSNCPLASRCLPKNVSQRRVCRDEYEPLREAMAKRMNGERGKAMYKRRSHAAETPFGFYKAVTGLRKYLLVGLAKVAVEQRWADTAYNLLKLVRFIARPPALTLTPAAAGP